MLKNTKCNIDCNENLKNFISTPSGRPRVWPIYNRENICESAYDEFVVVCKTEKDCENFDSKGLLATSSGGPAELTDWRSLAAREVIICVSNESADEKFAQSVRRILRQLKPPANVRMMLYSVDALGSKATAADWLIVQLGNKGVYHV